MTLNESPLNSNQKSEGKIVRTRRYGKSSSSLLPHKTTFFDENEQLLKKQKANTEIYKQQPRRTHCKNCDSPLGEAYDFIKNNIEYILCDHCQHLNGIYEDTTAYCEAIYIEDSRGDIAKDYFEKDVESYNYRLASIYLPKAEFLYTSLVNHMVDPHKLSYFDFGAGSGYFVGALRKTGLKHVTGTEISQAQVDFGNAMLGEPLLSVHELEDTIRVLQEETSEVVSLMGTLEHLQHPREVLRQLQQNPHVHYLYILVPMFSLSIYLEILLPHIYHRVLNSGGHTHLYTEESLLYLCQEFGFERIADWWFGTEMVDLYRYINITLEQTKSSKKLMQQWQQDFMSVIDAMQLEVDKKHFCSEVHMVFKKI